MVWELMKGSSKPTYCVITPSPTGDFNVACGDQIKANELLNMDKACLVEIHPDGRTFVQCDKGPAVLSRIVDLSKWLKR
ncbi:hypothetical protein TTSV1_gp14 [Thermoproteus tenax spherical virus 1]|uniref:Uncharacterized protein n=1 Tax=Thermoproteus tenax spherical virus 1 TaxID=292639 RepID=Q647E8_9VIRU|nr:hypothetical protein TTSV1_gp14 [Thermoproteus tenax spherical virus 1]AAU25964.1 hypothetical protein [Thermoproteus tenax spherical virus 1]